MAAMQAHLARRQSRPAQDQEGPDQDGLEIALADWPSVQLFFALGTQWRTHPMAGVRLGLDYPSIGSTAQYLGIIMTPDIFADLRIMEAAALAALAEKK